jgi:hypothetical protein
MDGPSREAWVTVAEGRECLRSTGALAWPAAPPGRRPHHALLLADPEGRVAAADVEAFARAALASGCCWFEIWGPRAHEIEARVDAVRDAHDAARTHEGDGEEDDEDHVVMTAASTPDEAGLADAVRMVLCATCSTDGHDAARTSRLFVLASGDEPFAAALTAWLRDPETIP